MDILLSNHRKAEISKPVCSILHALITKDWQSDPHYKHQNFAKLLIQDLKQYANWTLNWSGAPP